MYFLLLVLLLINFYYVFFWVGLDMLMCEIGLLSKLIMRLYGSGICWDFLCVVCETSFFGKNGLLWSGKCIIFDYLAWEYIGLR